MAPADDRSKSRIAGGDIGPGAHKPSEKHALDDVLKSLQDLIRNELLEDQRPPAPSAPPADPSVPRKRGRPRKPLPPEPPARETPPPPGADVEAVRNTLEHLVEHELNPDETTALPDDAAATETPVPTTAPAKRRGDQREFAFDLGETTSPAPEEHRPDAEETPSLTESQPLVEPEWTPENRFASEATEEITLASDEPRPPESLSQPAVTDDLTIGKLEEEFTLAIPPDDAVDSTAPPETPVEGAFIEERPAESDSAESFAHELAFDDIPVLQDVVAPPPAGGHSGEASAPPIDPQKLRDLSIRAVARLNIELRKRGEPPLDARLIDRLQGLLREELEMAAKRGK